MNPDYVLIGHIAHDETPDGPKLGGTVSYAGGAARAVGARIALVTSARQDDPVLAALPPVPLQRIDAPHSTIFRNLYEGQTRRQYLLSRAHAPLTLDHVPSGWRAARLIHLAPLDDEVDPALAFAFPGALIGVTPQGWMRAWDSGGLVRAKVWEWAAQLLPMVDGVVFSEEDIGRDVALEHHYAALARCLVVTRAAQGCTLYRAGSVALNLPAPSVEVRDATGAGDVFAGTFFALVAQDYPPEKAAAIATRLASISVTRAGLSGLPTPAEVAMAMAAM